MAVTPTREAVLPGNELQTQTNSVTDKRENRLHFGHQIEWTPSQQRIEEWDQGPVDKSRRHLSR